jgi:hypothetical protein
MVVIYCWASYKYPLEPAPLCRFDILLYRKHKRARPSPIPLCGFTKCRHLKKELRYTQFPLVRGSYVRVDLYDNFLLEVEQHSSMHVKCKESRWGGAERRQRRAVSSEIVLQAWLSKLVWNRAPCRLWNDNDQ